MSSIGIDRRTGKRLTGLDHVRQSLEVIFSTDFGERVERETFGSKVKALLGRSNLTASEVLRFYYAVHVALTLWEPRIKSMRVVYPQDQNTPKDMRDGRMGVTITAEYYPNALQGDFTSDVVVIDL